MTGSDDYLPADEIDAVIDEAMAKEGYQLLTSYMEEQRFYRIGDSDVIKQSFESGTARYIVSFALDTGREGVQGEVSVVLEDDTVDVDDRITAAVEYRDEQSTLVGAEEFLYDDGELFRATHGTI